MTESIITIAILILSIWNARQQIKLRSLTRKCDQTETQQNVQKNKTEQLLKDAKELTTVSTRVFDENKMLIDLIREVSIIDNKKLIKKTNHESKTS